MARRRPAAGKPSGRIYGIVGIAFLAVLVFSARVYQPAPDTRAPRRQKPPRTMQVSRLAATFTPPTPAKPAVTPAPRPLPPVPPPPAPSIPVFPRGRGKIAIVLDDWGYSLRQVPALASIRAPLTVAVLPGLPHSADVSSRAASYGHEVILHMPMEPMDPNAPREEGRTILQGMKRPEILQMLDRSLASVPGARGINNHQGSKVTADPVTMKTVLAEVKRRGLYFLDSYVSGDSVCEEVALQVRVPFAQRAVFLDNESDPGHIREQLVELARRAADQGEAIGIGHDRPATLACLRGAVEEMEKAGYTLVPVSELVEEP